MNDRSGHLDAELQQISRIRRTLLPDPIPQIPGLLIAASCETFTDLGGDIYDVFSLDDDRRWCVLIADAAGHGPAAAVVAAMVQATMRACANDEISAANLVRTLNRHLCRQWNAGTFATAFVGMYEPLTRQFTYSSAGHPPPMIPSFTDQPSLVLDQSGGLPLGIQEQTMFDEATLRLEPHQTLVLYTDGIPEARGRDGNFLGPRGIEESLRGCCGAPKCVADRIRRSVILHQGGPRPADDQTVVALRVERAGASARKA
jgi:sigma-B regulation protein RsbU (phosphoserine phosphatase)